MNPKKIGVVLAGGGARGIAHIGVLQAIEEAGIVPHVIAGSSAGAFAGAFYAAGYSPEKLLTFIKNSPLVRKLRPGLGFAGLIKSSSYREVLKEHLKVSSFDELQKKLYICVTNLDLGKVEYFSEGNVVDLVIASCAIPVFFTPMKIGEYQYSDGGLLNNFPIEPLEEECDLIIGVEVNPISEQREVNSIMKVLERALVLVVRENAKDRKPRADILIEPQALFAYNTFDLKKVEEIYKIGYEAAKETLKNHPLLQ